MADRSTRTTDRTTHSVSDCSSDSSPTHSNDEKTKLADINADTSDEAENSTVKARIDDVRAGSSDKPQRPKGVSVDMWEKFQRLKSQREKVSKKSTEKRIKILQDSILQKVQKEMSTNEELQSLRDHGITMETPPVAKKSKMVDASSASTSAERSSLSSVENDKPHFSKATGSTKGEKPGEKWMDFRPFLGCNDHLKGLDKGRYAPKSTLDEKLDAAVARGDLGEAERLSDQLASRELGTKITEAIDAKRYTEQKQKEEEKQNEKKKRKLQWGFTEKHRWETKSNM